MQPLEQAADSSANDVRDLRGVITDIGVGGIGLFSESMIEISDPFVCEIIAPHMPVGIPTLLRVLWVRKDGQGHSYRAGLQYLV